MKVSSVSDAGTHFKVFLSGIVNSGSDLGLLSALEAVHKFRDFFVVIDSDFLSFVIAEPGSHIYSIENRYFDECDSL
jgi:hypothetical protein